MAPKHLTPFAVLSGQFRGSVVRRWVIGEQRSAVDAAQVLTDHARRLNLVSREIPVPGSALSEWNKRKQPPLWAALAAFDLIIKRGWRPETHEDWAGFASLLCKLTPGVELENLGAYLPEGIDPQTASGWIAAAIEEDHHYRARKKLAAKDDDFH
ncbi:hypothetical protein [Type-D symbiont of Plautia stali]|uniref:hypothetical protein n=1 Tax=Type-D symbiont of Plautia stali TaxID=1560356 RepID=UPI00073ED975|nr:hypothetical protein [Type-D symbiont of Plautia stali]